MALVSKNLPDQPNLKSYSFCISDDITQLWRDSKDIKLIKQTIGHWKLETTSAYIKSIKFQDKVEKEEITDNFEIKCGGEYIDVKPYKEEMPNNIKHAVVYNTIGSMVNSDLYIVPEDHYFFLGDNRDCSRDSRFLSSVGYVHKDNLVGKARLIFFSNDTSKGSVLKIWNWNNSFRFKRLFKKLKWK